MDEYPAQNWKSIKALIQARTYKPQAVKRGEIPKPNGGVRKLGIPTVIDRTIEQAMAQVLMPIFEPTFSEHSYGFRPGRRAEQAIVQILEYFNDGYEWVVELDKELEARGLRFTRYVDDCVIIVRSSVAATRVIYSVTDWIERKLGLD
ncbi:MAG: hypothetical protein IIY70_04810 [Oscillospiraceae bacterium]|nr:hypothetical protein [Oscillospiraceae bacterium]